MQPLGVPQTEPRAERPGVCAGSRREAPVRPRCLWAGRGAPRAVTFVS